MQIKQTLLLICFPFFFYGLNAQEIELTPSGSGYKFSLNPPPRPPFRPLGSQEKPKWLYFWDFGDGHYSEKISPTHTYVKTGDYEVKVHLTAAYSLDRQKKFTKTFTANKSGIVRSNSNYPKLSNNSTIRITTDNNELVMRDQLQLVVHYRPPPGYSSGYSSTRI